MAGTKETKELARFVSTNREVRAVGGASIDLDRNLEQILASLAQLLVASGYGFNRAMSMTKAAFVNADVAERMTKSINLSPSAIESQPQAGELG